MLRNIWQLCRRQPELPLTLLAAVIVAGAIGYWVNDFNRPIERTRQSRETIEIPF